MAVTAHKPKIVSGFMLLLRTCKKSLNKHAYVSVNAWPSGYNQLFRGRGMKLSRLRETSHEQRGTVAI